MTKETVIKKLREQGFRITKQRRVLLDIILNDDCTCCKEIYYKASMIDNSIGTATVYRMINTLEDIGAITRNNTYHLEDEESSACSEACLGNCNKCHIEFNDGTAIHLSPQQWSKIMETGLEKCGYIKKNQNIKNVIVHSA